MYVCTYVCMYILSFSLSPYLLCAFLCWYLCHYCGILPKKCHVTLSPLHTQTVPFATCGIAHSTRERILSGRRSTFSGYFTSGAWRRMGEEDISTSLVRHVRILWSFLIFPTDFLRYFALDIWCLNPQTLLVTHLS